MSIHAPEDFTTSRYYIGRQFEMDVLKSDYELGPDWTGLSTAAGATYTALYELDTEPGVGGGVTYQSIVGDAAAVGTEPTTRRRALALAGASLEPGVYDGVVTVEIIIGGSPGWVTGDFMFSVDIAAADGTPRSRGIVHTSVTRTGQLQPGTGANYHTAQLTGSFTDAEVQDGDRLVVEFGGANGWQSYHEVFFVVGNTASLPDVPDGHYVPIADFNYRPWIDMALVKKAPTTDKRFYFANDTFPSGTPSPVFSDTLVHVDGGMQFGYLSSEKHGHPGETSRGVINSPGANPRHVITDVSDADVLPVGEVKGTWRYVLHSEFYTTGNAQPHIRMLVVSGDGATKRGVLFSGVVPATKGANVINVLQGTLDPVVVEAGDRLVVERGTKWDSVGSYNSIGYYYDAHDIAGDDYRKEGGGAPSPLHAGWLDLYIEDESGTGPTELPLFVGADRVSKLMLGSSDVTKLYLGSSSVY